MKISVIGTGLTHFGELGDKSLFDLTQEAIKEALENSQIDPQKIEAVFVANMLSGNLLGQNHLGPVVTSMLGRNVPAFAIEAACASGGTATHLAIQSLLAGTYKNVLVLGVEKMTDDTTADVTTGLMGAASEEERLAGLSFPCLYAMLANAHMQKYKTTSKQLALVAVKNHFNGSLNPNAQFQNKITVEKVLGSTMVADPLTLFDCSPITDGAAAIILSSEDSPHSPAITGSAVATDHISISSRQSMTELLATKLAAQKAYAQAGISAKDVDVAEVHDCFTIAEILAYEDLGFCAKGQGGKLIRSGATELTGQIPVNTSGGLKACGHPVGATGIKQIIEITNQLLGKAEKRQIKNAKIGLTHNVGGSGATAAVHILQI